MPKTVFFKRKLNKLSASTVSKSWAEHYWEGGRFQPAPVADAGVFSSRSRLHRPKQITVSNGIRRVGGPKWRDLILDLDDTDRIIESQDETVQFQELTYVDTFLATF